LQCWNFGQWRKNQLLQMQSVWLSIVWMRREEMWQALIAATFLLDSLSFASLFSFNAKVLKALGSVGT
jgi:hypothetical protein